LAPFLVCVITASGAYAQTFKVITDQVFVPSTSLVQGLDGDFYGVESPGVFKVSADGTLTIVAEGAGSEPLILATDGNFYGVNDAAGPHGFGGIIKLTPSGSYSILHDFQASEGEHPYNGGLTQGSDGDLYGTNFKGGEFGGGTAYKITLAGTFEKLYDFPRNSGPAGSLILASDGNFYGVTYYGGTAGEAGTVFQMTPAGVVTTLHSFGHGSDGGYPEYGLVQAADGKLYETTCFGGSQ
jgi:uncharacterized repeat protein (TIGR03803 family)